MEEHENTPAEARKLRRGERSVNLTLGLLMASHLETRKKVQQQNHRLHTIAECQSRAAGWRQGRDRACSPVTGRTEAEVGEEDRRYTGVRWGGKGRDSRCIRRTKDRLSFLPFSAGSLFPFVVCWLPITCSNPSLSPFT